MANMTLRLDDAEELKLTELMQLLNETTKSKTIIKMIDTHYRLKSDLSYYIEESRASKYELNKLKDLLRQRFNLDNQLKEFIS